MTTQKSFKTRIRARMEKTGESYTAARRHLLPAEPAPEPKAERRMSDDAIRRNTGRTWDEWFAVLDRWGAQEQSHRDIALHLNQVLGVPGWWAQNITVAYEHARGLRPVGGTRAGTYEVGATKTVNVPVERLYAAFVDPELRERWLPGAELRERTAKPNRTARFDWEDGSTRVIVGFTAKDAGKSQVAVSHERLPDADTAGEMKTFWRARMVALKQLLEAG
jgi:hypothetical protein